MKKILFIISLLILFNEGYSQNSYKIALLKYKGGGDCNGFFSCRADGRCRALFPLQ